MRKNKKTRKGFTLVELLIVIAILAVLATVAILGYTQFTKKANISNDQAICNQMNLALQSNEALDNKAQYAQQAVDQCREAGFILENLTPSTTGYHFAYDQKNNRFMLLDDKFNFNYGDTKHSAIGSENVNVFVVVGNQKEFNESKTNGFSAYLKSDFEETVTTLTTDKGIDVGDCTTITSINYINNAEEQNVVIRTNSYDTVLTINAPSDKVKHFGYAETVNIESISSTSYFEYGNVIFVDIKNGRLVITDGEDASIGTIYLSATNGEYKDIILATMNNAKTPKIIQREPVAKPTGADEKIIIVTIQQVNGEGTPDSSKTEKIYLYANHVAYEETKKYTGVSSLGQLVLEAVEGTAASVHDTNANNYIDKIIEVAKEDAKNQAIINSSEDSEDSSVLLVKSKSVFKALSTLDYTTKKIVILSDIDMTGEEWTSLGSNDGISIEIEGNNHTIKGLSKSLIYQTDNVSISNLTIEMDTPVGNIPAKNAAFVAYAPHAGSGDSKTITLTNCHARGTIKATDTAGGLLGWISGKNETAPTTINVNNCTVDAVIESGYRAGGILGHCSYIADGSLINNVTVSGSISSTNQKIKAVGGLIGFVAGGTKLAIRNCTVNSVVKAQFEANYGEFTAECNENTIIGVCDPAFNNANNNQLNKLYDQLVWVSSSGSWSPQARFDFVIKGSLMYHSYKVEVNLNNFKIDTEARVSDLLLDTANDVNTVEDHMMWAFKNNTTQINSIIEHYNAGTLDELVSYCPFTDSNGTRLAKTKIGSSTNMPDIIQINH